MSAARPIYETQSDRDAEQRVASFVAARWKCHAMKLPVQYRLDYALTRGGNVVSWLEVKVRRVSMAQIGEWGGYLLSLMKWTAANDLADATGLPFTLAVRATDGLHAAVIREFPTLPAQVGGRRDRGDPQDVEPVVLIPVAWFRRVD